MSINNVESKFNRLPNINFLYSTCSIQDNPSNCIYNKVTNYLDKNFNDTVVSDMEVASFICIKYSYYLRNKIFHAEKHDLSFRLIDNKLTDELDWINNFLETLVLELIKTNTSWVESE
jgi:hypothetical protein